MTEFATLGFRWLELKGANGQVIAHIELNRPRHANALSREMIDDLAAALSMVSAKKECRAMILSGAGKNFSAGADLNWMRASTQLSKRENQEEASHLGALFTALDGLAVPTIARIQGAAFGGAVGLAACCDISIADASAKFCLSEVRLGLLPAVILPFLQRRMQAGALRGLCLSAAVFSAEQAHQFGLLDKVCHDGDLAAEVQSQLNMILAGGKAAQSAVKKLLRDIARVPMDEAVHLGAEAIAQARSGVEGQEGLGAFLEKRSPNWTDRLDDTLVFS